jgi:predicted ATPase
MLEEIEEANKNVEKGLKEEYISATICYGTGVCSKIAYYKAKLGHVESGLQLINDILSDAVTKNEFYSLAEIYRLKAEILLMKGDQNQAEDHYQKSLDLARQQEAKSWELRASLGLATLWISQGKHNQAEQLLSPIYAWFTEGQDTPDLVQAKKLLIEIETLKNAA